MNLRFALMLTASAVLAAGAARAQTNPGFVGGVGAPPLTAAALNAAFALKADVANVLLKANDLSDVPNPTLALSNLGGLAAVNDLSDVPNPTLALSNLGGLAKSNNLGDVPNPSAALSNLGGLARANNLSDLASIPTADTNLGLGTGSTPVFAGVLAGKFESGSGTSLIVSPGGGGQTITFGDSKFGAGAIGTMTLPSSGGSTASTVQFNGTLTSRYFNSTNPTYTETGTGITPVFRMAGNYTGQQGTFGSNPPYEFAVSSDTMDTLTGNSGGGSPMVFMVRNFGGTGTVGGRSDLRVSMGPTADYSDTTSTEQFTGLEVWMTGAHWTGGTLANPQGSFYGLNPQSVVSSENNYYALMNGAEWDSDLHATNQTVTLGGTVTAGDTESITIAGSEIAGSPITVTATSASGNNLTSIGAQLNSLLVSNSALTAADIGSLSAAGVVTIYWPGQDSDIAVTVSTSGGATETMTLGAVAQGGSVATKYGQSIVNAQQDTGRGFGYNAGIQFAAQGGNFPTSGGWDAFIHFGADTYSTGSAWPLDRTGAIIQAGTQTAYGGNNKTGQINPDYATYGIDFHYVDFADQNGDSLWLPGMQVNGLGSPIVGNATLSSTTTGASLDVTGQQMTFFTISSGGGGGSGSNSTNYYPGDIVYGPNNGMFVVSTVNWSTGAMTALRQVIAPTITSGSPPTNPVSLFGGSGTGLKITETWTPATTLKLNPSGGSVAVGASLLPSATTGFIYVPSGSGAPTGTPTSITGLVPMYLDTTDNKACFYMNSAWKCATLS